MFKNLTAVALLFLFTTEIALASSISTRVRVLENKVGVVERKLNQGSQMNPAQLEQIEKNTQAIEILTIRMDKVQANLGSNQQPGLAKSKSRNIAGVAQVSNNRFTDSLYSYP